MKNKSRMFPFITRTWNPEGGRCPHNCVYCWSMGEKGLVKRYDMEKYKGDPYLVEKELKKRFKDTDFVFIEDMSDLFAWNVPREDILKIFKVVENHPRTIFLTLTKNPERYLGFKTDIPSNVILGATIETDKQFWGISDAPNIEDRMFFMYCLSKDIPNKLFISIEPILEFSLKDMVIRLELLRGKLWGVAVGYDNYDNNLPEPTLAKTMKLIKELEKIARVYRKTLRKRSNATVIRCEKCPEGKRYMCKIGMCVYCPEEAFEYIKKET